MGSSRRASRTSTSPGCRWAMSAIASSARPTQACSEVRSAAHALSRGLDGRRARAGAAAAGLKRRPGSHAATRRPATPISSSSTACQRPRRRLRHGVDRPGAHLPGLAQHASQVVDDGAGGSVAERLDDHGPCRVGRARSGVQEPRTAIAPNSAVVTASHRSAGKAHGVRRRRARGRIRRRRRAAGARHPRAAPRNAPRRPNAGSRAASACIVSSRTRAASAGCREPERDRLDHAGHQRLAVLEQLLQHVVGGGEHVRCGLVAALHDDQAIRN